MIDISTETLLTMGQAAGVRPPGRLGRPTHAATVYRWISRGLRGVRLESIRLGGTLYTSREALQRFAESLTCRATADGENVNSRAAQSHADAAAVEDTLDQLGL
jgi:hypothetical protein